MRKYRVFQKVSCQVLGVVEAMDCDLAGAWQVLATSLDLLDVASEGILAILHDRTVAD